MTRPFMKISSQLLNRPIMKISSQSLTRMIVVFSFYLSTGQGIILTRNKVTIYSQLLTGMIVIFLLSTGQGILLTRTIVKIYSQLLTSYRMIVKSFSWLLTWTIVKISFWLETSIIKETYQNLSNIPFTSPKLECNISCW